MGSEGSSATLDFGTFGSSKRIQWKAAIERKMIPIIAYVLPP